MRRADRLVYCSARAENVRFPLLLCRSPFANIGVLPGAARSLVIHSKAVPRG